MAASDNLNPVLFGFRVTLKPDRTDPSIEVTDPQGEWVGHLSWESHNDPKNWREGNIADVDVHPNYQGRGIATAMWQRAQQAHRDSPWHYPKPTHSSFRTPEGDAWAYSLHRKGLAPEPPDNRMEWDED